MGWQNINNTWRGTRAIVKAGDGGGLAGIARRNRLLEYPTCVDCLFHSRKLLPRESIHRIALRTRSRTELFVETFLESGEDLNGRRRSLNEKYLELLPHIAPLLQNPRDALAISALGNSLDHNMKWWGDEGLELEEALQRLLEKARVDPAAVEALEASRKVAILLDNSGEAVIDLALALSLAAGGKSVTLVARDQVYEIDVDRATVQALLGRVAEKLGLERAIAGIRVLGTGGAYPAPSLRGLPAETRGALEAADLVISKGIANAEALLDTCYPAPGKTLVLLTAKCPPIARLFGVEMGTPVARLGYPCGLETRIVRGE